MLISVPHTKRFEGTLYSREWLQREYVDAGRNAAQVAALLGCTRGAVLDALRRHSLPIRDASAAHAVARQTGSSVPRPRSKFLQTLHNRSWLLQRVQEGLSASQIAREAACSPPSVKKSLERFGLYDRWREACFRNRPSVETRLERRTRSTFKDSEGGWRNRARKSVPSAPCSICGAEDAIDVNHVDGDVRNVSAENLERLCRRCHRMQHAEESRVALRLLDDRGVGRKKIAMLARYNLVKERKKMPNDKVSARDSVTVGLERTPAVDFPCAKCGKGTVKHEDPPGRRCPSCQHFEAACPN